MAFERSNLKRLLHIGYAMIAAMCLLLVHSPVALGQVDEGSVIGTVQDPTGAVIPNAQVTLLNTDQGITLETHTSSAGDYTFSPVRIGHYTVSVTAPGFSTTTQQNLTVTVGQQMQVNISLKTGAATETVTVTEAPPQLQTEDSSVGQVVNEHTVNSLPLNGRNFTFLAQLSAGVNTSQADTRGNAASGAFTANGLQPDQNNYLLDGIDNNSNAADFLNGTNFVILPPVDAIAEFKVQTADFSAELGRSAGAVLNATIKSGTNSFHAQPGSSSATTSLMRRTGLKTTAGSRRVSFGRTSLAAPSAVRSSRTSSSSSATTKVCVACREPCLPVRSRHLPRGTVASPIFRI